jgi:hypothetical protein
MFGWGYVINSCISLFKNQQEEKAYKNYVTECLRIITENTAKFGGGSYMQIKFSELIDQKPQDDRTADEIIQGIKEKVENLK